MKAERKRVGSEFIKEAFRNVYQREWEKKGKSLKEFAERYAEIEQGSEVTEERTDAIKAQVSRWKNGHKAPSAKSIKIICQVFAAFGVDAQKEFYPSTYEDKYRYSSEYQDAIAERNEHIAKDCFGLNLSFLYGLKQLIDFDSEFPAFAHLEWSFADPVNGFPFGVKYERVELASAAKGENGKSLFQIENGGKVITLQPADMKYLKAVQNFIVRKVREQFAHHRQELIDSMNEATEQCKDYLRPGAVVHIGKDPLSPEELQKIDKWGIYTEQELNKYKIPDSPEELPITAAYIEKESEFHLGSPASSPEELQEFFKQRREARKRGEAVPDAEGAETDPGGGIDPGGNDKNMKGGSDNGKARER